MKNLRVESDSVPLEGAIGERGNPLVGSGRVSHTTYYDQTRGVPERGGIVDAEQEPTEPVTLCIAAECVYEEEPAIAMCCDWRAQTGDIAQAGELIGAEDVYKMAPVGKATAMLAGVHPRAMELVMACKRAIQKFTNYRGERIDFDLAIDDFMKELRGCAGGKKAEIIQHFVKMSVGKDYEDFCKLPNDNYLDEWNSLRRLTLDADILIAHVGHDPVIIRLDRWGRTHFENNYGAIGNGSDIARAFLCLQLWDAAEHREMLAHAMRRVPLRECLYRIYEAKQAAHSANPSSIGACTAFQVLTRNGRHSVAPMFAHMLDVIFNNKHKVPNFTNYSIKSGREGEALKAEEMEMLTTVEPFE
jgi:hypothetical protein